MSKDEPLPVATAIWRITDALVVALDDLFGEPVDAYVNGSQVWLREDGPNGVTLEWRLHPVAGYVKPKGMQTAQVFSNVALALAQASVDDENGARNDKRTDDLAPVASSSLWDGLEAFAAYDDDFTPKALRDAVNASLAIAPDAVGMVDHEPIGDAWEAAEGNLSVIETLLQQLQ